MATPEVIHFKVDEIDVIGHLYKPHGPGPHPALVVGGPMTSVKEQVTGVYAKTLAERGFAALALDHRHYGESGGEPRQYEDHARKVADLRAGLAHLAERSDVDSHRLGAAGVCLGAGYAAWAAVDNPLVKAFGAVAGYYRDPADMRARDAAGFDAKVEQGLAARRHFERSGEVLTIPAAALDGDAAMQTTDTVDYYTRRAAVPAYVNAFAVMSRERFLPFDVQDAAARLRVPVLMIHSETALSPVWARRFYDSLMVPKEMIWVRSRGQTDFYDDPGLVGLAADRLAEHFQRRFSTTV
jgi:hypothetical protein